MITFLVCQQADANGTVERHHRESGLLDDPLPFSACLRLALADLDRKVRTAGQPATERPGNLPAGGEKMEVELLCSNGKVVLVNRLAESESSIRFELAVSYLAAHVRESHQPVVDDDLAAGMLRAKRNARHLHGCFVRVEHDAVLNLPAARIFAKSEFRIGD